MSRRPALALALTLLCWAGPPSHAQSPLTGGVVPSRTALSRLGLERQWITMAPVAGSERVLRVSRGKELLFVQTSESMLHVYEAETGRPVWSAKIGDLSQAALPVSQNSYAVFVTSANTLSALDRATGRLIWKADLGTLPTSGTTADEDRVLVGLGTGMVRCYDLKEKQDKAPDKLLDHPKLAWQIVTGGQVRTRPILAGRIACIGGGEGKVYVNQTLDGTALFRIVTGGSIGRDMASHGTRTLLAPSSDNNLYAVDVLTSKISWIFPSGAPIDQGPIVAQDEIFVINEAGNLSVLDPASGSPRWTVSTDSGRLLSVSPSKVYLVSQDNDLMVVARDSGRMLLDPAATYQRAGLNLREYELSFPSRYDDRMYMATPSGVILCLREIGQTAPAALRDPKAKPFGYIPPEGIKELPNPFEEAPAAEEGETPEPPADGTLP